MQVTLFCYLIFIGTKQSHVTRLRIIISIKTQRKISAVFKEENDRKIDLYHHNKGAKGQRWGVEKELFTRWKVSNRLFSIYNVVPY